MFIIYHSNKLDILKDIMAKLIKDKPLSDPLDQEIVLIQNNNIAQWLQIQLAKYFSVSANIKFFLPENFIWKMFNRILKNISDKYLLSKSIVTWRLMSILPKLYKRKEFTEIKKYFLNDDDKRKCFNLSVKISNLFNKYLIYRPDWLKKWQNGKLIDNIGNEQKWQAILWRNLILEIKKENNFVIHRVNLYKNFILKLKKDKKIFTKLPKRIFIFGISTLPPCYLEILNALSNHIDIHFLFINPCKYYWEDICSKYPISKLMNKKNLINKDENKNSFLFNKSFNYKINNPILASFGKLGCETIYLLSQIKRSIEIKAFIDNSKQNLLNLLQQDILMLEDYSILNHINKNINSSNRRMIKINDKSLSFHICHSPQREIEVLHDNILEIISKDKTIKPRHIIVIVPEINIYIPSIQAIFNNNLNKNHLPFSILNQKIEYLNPIISIFFKILNLPYSRFSSKEVIEFLEISSISKRFSINTKELVFIRKFIIESGIRWGLDDNMLLNLSLPLNNKHTWKFGLNRMLLGCAMNSKDGIWQNIFPYNIPNYSKNNIIGKLSEFILCLQKWKNWLSIDRNLNEWLNCASNIIKDFFLIDNKIKYIITLLKNKWEEILKYGLEAKFKDNISILLLKDELNFKLKKEKTNNCFNFESINFCNFMPMHMVSFKVVCLLGMNHGSYPKEIIPENFNLMIKNSRFGDKNKKDEDRYFFLEALLSAQKKLYISFIGKSIQDNTTLYPSVLINELNNYIVQSFYLFGNKETNENKISKQIKLHLWNEHSRVPFSKENFLIKNKNQSFAKEWLPAARNQGVSKDNFIKELKLYNCKTIECNELLSFFYDPIKTWFKKCLLVSFYPISNEITENESFIINDKICYELNLKLINTFINKGDINKLFYEVKASGLLPYGSFGDLFWKKQYKDMKFFYNKIQNKKNLNINNIKVNLKIKDICLYGYLHKIQKNGLLRWSVRSLSIRDGLILWLEHLIYCSLGNSGESIIISPYNEYRFASLDYKKAKYFLNIFISGYIKGMRSPLFLLYKSGGAWLNYCYDFLFKNINYDINIQNMARLKLIQAWKGYKNIIGDKQNIYINRLIYRLNEEHINSIITASKKYFQPVLKFNLIKK